MSKRLEDFMAENREEFDDLQPRADIWNNISKELDAWEAEQLPKKREAKTFSLGFVLRVAAMIVVVMGIGFGIYIQSQKTNGEIDLAAINPTYAKQQVQYASLIETKRTELKQIAKFDPQLNNELVKMQANYKKLSTDLATSPNQERVLRAMIRNLQIQTEVLNQQLSVIQQFNQSKKEQQNGTKDI
jgi:septal ring factor EnvC (AmiA/AmiB activator)